MHFFQHVFTGHDSHHEQVSSSVHYTKIHVTMGDRGVTVVKVAGSIPAGVIGIFHLHKILPTALWPWGRLSL